MTTISAAIPDLPALLAAIDAGCTNHGSYIHGSSHWRAVAWSGLYLCRHTPGANPVVALLFGMFHDVMRLNDGHDPQHGPRAAVFAASLHGKHFHLSRPELKQLLDACEGHTSGLHAADPTVAVCWDADRLNLWRIGVRPDPRFLSTETARQPEVIDAASDLEGERYSWEQIVAAYIAHEASGSDR